MSFRCVVDANVAVKLFLIEAGTPKARALFDLLVSFAPAQFYVPDAFYYEVASTLRKAAASATYPDYLAHLRQLALLNLNSTPTNKLLFQAAHISMNHPVSYYDALYLALTVRENAPLITADRRLLRALEGSLFDARALDDLD